MKPVVNALLFAVFAVGSASSADACCLWPFGGWYGAGYGAAPAYGYSGYSGAGYSGYYSAGYPAYSAPAYGVGYYQAGYATSSNCCAPSCCNSCDDGSCGSSSCVGSTSSGSLKPTTDPNFDRSSPKSKEYDRDGVRSRDTSDDVTDPLPRRRTRSTDPAEDDFDREPAGGSGSDGSSSDGMFPVGDEGIQNSKKPPMTDPADETPADSTDPKKDGTTFLEGESTTLNNSTRNNRRRDSLAERSSGLNEVIAPKRLASRSLPSNSTGSKTSFAGKSNDNKRGVDAPIRWISIPTPEGQARL